MKLLTVLISLAGLFFILLAYTQTNNSSNISLLKNNVSQNLVFLFKNDTNFHLPFSDVPVLIDFPNSYIDLLSAIEKDKHIYILLNIYFSSIFTGAISTGAISSRKSSRCDAGEEHYLVWIKLDEAHSISSTQEQLYSSCIYSLEINSPVDAYPPITIDTLSKKITLIHIYNDDIIDIQYDVSMPENGLKITTR